ncbi:hypothetical protein D3C87_739370 [compost metagenome]
MNVLSSLMVSSVFLRCPACAKSPIFDGFFKIHPECGTCGQTFTMKAGEFTGGAYMNYGVTAILATAAYFVLEATMDLSVVALTTILVIFGAIFPFLFLRNSRAFFMALLYVTGALKDDRAEGQ